MKRLLMGILLASTGAVASDYSYVSNDSKLDESKPYKGKSYSPYGKRNFPNEPLWGDTHLHTNLSLDARAAGVLLSPADAYRFARGEEVVSSRGESVRIGRPLDFLVVTDHSDAMGAMNEIIKGNPDLMVDPVVQEWHEKLTGGDQQSQLLAGLDVVDKFSQGNTPKILMNKTFARTIWEQVIDAAEYYNDPGQFTAMIGYEWTSTTAGDNLHRNVIYRDGGDVAGQVLPYTVVESDNPEDLWKWMAGYEKTTGGKVLAIPHNGNLSNGLMFPNVNPATNKPLTESYAKNRARWEPLYEVTQIKGDGEAHPFLSPTDEFSDYETWDWGNLGPVVKKQDMLQYEYAREALKNGLKHEATLGTNPYKFGLQGATDSHTALATAGEDNYFGKHSLTEPNKKRMKTDVGHFDKIHWYGWAQVASGYTGVWAANNTRGAIFDAMMRKETYATTGSRIAVRLFAGWDFVAEDALVRLPANVGYQKGVPMGGDLTSAPKGKSPSFLVAARKDAFSGNLDRIQIVKGWLDDNGETHEKVYDVVWSGDREIGKDGKLPAVGNTVDIKNATWSNTIGEAELITVWVDPDFKAQERAFYYARVLEIPTPRWTAYEAKYFKVEAPKEAPMTTQERAYTSPIWYTP